MACEKSGELMMKYMDGLLDGFERMNLDKHIEVCEVCREDFTIYKEMLLGFNYSNMEIIEAPEGFAGAVMEKVDEINLYFPKKVRDKGKVMDNIIFGIWAAIAAVFALGTVLFFQGETIFNWLYANGFEAAAAGLAPFADFAAAFGATLGHYISAVSEPLGAAAGNFVLVFLVAFVGLVAVQFCISPQFAKIKERRRKTS